ncbi:MAG: glycosyl transferase, partial [Spirochaetaceae bacterium]|nr:glycosyl transferase [Spirochaetaceae bacterium]
ILGIRPGYDALTIDPCIPPEWKGFTVRRVWRGAVYEIEVANPQRVSKGVRECRLNEIPQDTASGCGIIPAQAAGSVNHVTVMMGKSG